MGRKPKHGHRGGGKSVEYSAWDKMKQRCYNPNYKNYKYYGARGIRVCDRWLNSFEAFLEDMGKRPSENHSLDRYPNKYGNYEPSNCRWATIIQQANNTTRNRLIEFNGKTQTMTEWIRELELKRSTVIDRLNNGRPLSVVFSKEPLKRGGVKLNSSK